MNDEKKPKSKDETAIIARARKRAQEGSTYWQKNRELAKEDLRFLGGDQWPDNIKTQRENDGRPCLVNNVLPTYIDQLVGDQRQNRPAIKVSPVDVVRTTATDKNTELKIQSKTGQEQYTLGEVMTNMIRSIEYNCDAETSYDIAYQCILDSGMGFLRVRSDYLTDNSFEQDLIIDHIENQFSVTIDPAARERDKSDMNWCLIDELIPREDFEEMYPDASTDGIGGGDSTTDVDAHWFLTDSVRVSEYFTREPVTKTMLLLSDGRTVYKDEVEDVLDELEQKGITVQRERKVKTHKTMWRKITGAEVLEGPIEVDCSTIPVVPVWGKSHTLGEETIFRSLHRYAHDAMRMANYWESAATESIALAPKAPFIGTEDQIEGYEEMWETANTENHSILKYNKESPNDPGPRREQPAAVPAAEITMAMNSNDKIKQTIGMFDASMGNAGNEVSGRAIIARQRQGDRGSYAFTDNLSRALRRVGKILVEMIPKTYDTERTMRLKFEDGTEDFVLLNEQILDEQSKKWVTINDLNVSKYDVEVTIGPSYQTQRMEAAESMIQFAQAVPEAAAVMADLIAQNMDWPGADVIAERLKKIVPPQVLSQSEREQLAEDMPEPEGPNPEQELAMAEMQARKSEAEAKIATSQSDVEQEQQKTLQAQLKTQEAQAKLAEIEMQAAQGGEIEEQVRDLVAQAIAEMMQGDNQTI